MPRVFVPRRGARKRLNRRLAHETVLKDMTEAVRKVQANETLRKSYACSPCYVTGTEVNVIQYQAQLY